MKFNWILSCSLEEAKEIIKSNIDGPFTLPFIGKNFQGFNWGNSFTIWNKHEGIGNRTAIAKIKLIKENNETRVVAQTLMVFPSSIAPSSPKFYWFLVSITVLLWIATVLVLVFDQYIYLLKFIGLLTAIGIVLMLLGFSKMMGNDNIVFLEKFLNQTLSTHRKNE